MTWSYSGDPGTSELDSYRFLIGDTIDTEKLLQNEEIQYVLNTYSDENIRLMKLYESLYNYFSRDIKKSLGPQSEDPSNRQKYAKEKLEYYRKLAAAAGFSVPVYAYDKVFGKGLFSNV